MSSGGKRTMRPAACTHRETCCCCATATYVHEPEERPWAHLFILVHPGIESSVVIWDGPPPGAETSLGTDQMTFEQRTNVERQHAFMAATSRLQRTSTAPKHRMLVTSHCVCCYTVLPRTLCYQGVLSGALSTRLHCGDVAVVKGVHRRRHQLRLARQQMGHPRRQRCPRPVHRRRAAIRKACHVLQHRLLRRASFSIAFVVRPGESHSLCKV